jgi:hypothetical protein
MQGEPEGLPASAENPKAKTERLGYKALCLQRGLTLVVQRADHFHSQWRHERAVSLTEAALASTLELSLEESGLGGGC